jgi:7-cyano-7-deazaguanine synthase
MCSIIGAVLDKPDRNRAYTNSLLRDLWFGGLTRGRDGRGYVWNDGCLYSDGDKSVERSCVDPLPGSDIIPQIDTKRTVQEFVMVGNMRAEPTTEYIKEKRLQDQQPYSLEGWHIAHNGTIANDKELRVHTLPAERVDTEIDSAAIVERLQRWTRVLRSPMESFYQMLKEIKGSFAILAYHDSTPDKMYFACNYRPIWFTRGAIGVFAGSARGALPNDYGVPEMVTPYSYGYFTANGIAEQYSLHELLAPAGGTAAPRALVVCSGGLDSVVSAAWAWQQYAGRIHLLNFQYGSRAEQPEIDAIRAVAEHMQVGLTLFPLPIYDKSDSPLLQADSAIAGGEQGAEFAHEWVPARNLVLLSVATAFAEAKGYDVIVLGNNLEEAGAYPDNEPEFIARFNDLLPFAVGDGKRVRVEMPVGNLMKHEIVALGKQVNAPMHLTWSCYRAGTLHCGTCGPCYMRRKAFEINGIEEVITYAI